MLIALAVAASILLPILFLVMSVPDKRFCDRSIDLDTFTPTFDKILFAGDFAKGVVLCSRVTGDVPLMRGMQAMLIKPQATLAELEGVAEAYGQKAEIAVRLQGLFSPNRLLRNLFCLGSPIAMMAANGMEQGWVVGPLTISLVLMGVMALRNWAFRLRAEMDLAKTGEVLRRYASIIVQSRTVGALRPDSSVRA